MRPTWLDGQIEDWKKGQREMARRAVEMATLLDERGLAKLVLALPELLPKSWRARAAAVVPVGGEAGAYAGSSAEVA